MRILIFCCFAVFGVLRAAPPSTLSNVELSADNHLLYTVRAPGKLTSTIWIAQGQDNEGIPLVEGSLPRWSPDAQWVAYLSDSHLHVISADSGDPQQLFDLPVQGFHWAPDSQSLAVVAATPMEPSHAPYVVDGTPDPTQLWLVDLEGNSRQLTDSALYFDGQNFIWTPDGNALIATCQPTGQFNDFPLRTLHTVDATTGEMELLIDHMVSPVQPHLSHDGSALAFVAGDQELPWAFAASAHLLFLSDHDLHQLSPTPDQSLQYTSRGGLLGWEAGDQALIAAERWGTKSAVYRIPVDGSAVETILDDWVLSALSLSSDGTTLACVVEDLEHPPEVALIDLQTGTVTITTSHNQHLDPIGRTERMHWTAPDGMEIEGLLTYPTDPASDHPLPTIVMLHGGPGGVWSEHFYGSPYNGVHPIAALTEGGYAVFRPNIRGSQGYGRPFRFANAGDWGGGDYQDVMSGLDHLIARGIADPDRLGIMGWSYGGYLSAWTITQTDRFQAACVGAPLINLVSTCGTSDIASFVPCFFGTEVYEDPTLLMEHSPITYVGNVTTPTLLLHGDGDIRCPTTQSHEFYTQLKRQGISVQLVLYPVKGHTPTDPTHQEDLTQRHVEWFDTYLRPT